MKKNNVEMICDIGELTGLFQNSSSMGDFLKTVVRTLQKHMQADACSIFLQDESSGDLVLKSTVGLADLGRDEVRLKPGEGITGLAFKELRPLLIHDARSSHHYKFVPGLNEEHFNAILAVPIVRGQEKVGVIVVHHKRRDFFDAQDVKALKAIGSQLAATLENAKLLMEIQERKENSSPLPAPKAPIRKEFFKGRGASEGIALGKAVVLGHSSDEIAETLDSASYRTTLEDFETALKNAESQLESLQKEMESKFADVASLIFSTHILMLRDDGFSGSMARLIKTGTPPATAVMTVVNQYVQIFSASQNARLAEKVQDVKDLGHRLLRNLNTDEVQDGDYSGQIVVAQELLPSELIKISAQHAEGLLLFGAGASAHVSILAKSLGIPVIFTDDEDFSAIRDQDFLILDGYQGSVFLNPSPKIEEQYRGLKSGQSTSTAETGVRARTLTLDGVEIKILANINLLSDLRIAKKFQAAGIGLYRSEFPFIIRNNFPSEEEQFVVYRKLLDEMEGREVVLRTLDVGGDKVLSYLPNGGESNPFLGLRAIRFSLKNKDIFHNQLRAMLRAGHQRELRIMFPLISSLDDFLEAKEEVLVCQKQLREEKIPHCENPLVGAMVELPSAVEVANELAREADFLSVGSNDLVQYLLGVDRTNEAVSSLYVAQHPAVLRALQRVIRAAVNHDTSVSICGELAADPTLIPFLIGAGLKKLSVNPKLIPQVQKAVESYSFRECLVIAEKALSLGTIKEVREFLGAAVK